MKCDNCPYKDVSLDCNMKCEVKLPSKEKKIYRIPQVSKKRSVEQLQYTVLRTEFLAKKENQICPITKQATTEIHHTFSGKDRAKYFLDTTTWIAVSRDGHNWIHDNPKEARELNYLK